MSRKPPASTTARTGIARAPSTTSLSNMPPPPAPARSRPASSMSMASSSGGQRQVSGSAEAAGTGKMTPPPPPESPGRKKEAGKGKENENGEINIQVVVRCRGRSPLEVTQRTPIILTSQGAISREITIETSTLSSSSSMAGLPTSSLSYNSHTPVSKTYGFDRVFGPEADQTCVYKEVVEGMLDEVLSGYNCTIFAYGQTGTGKTYTMQGDLSLTPLGTPTPNAGIIPRVLHRLFSLLDATPNSEYSVKCSYVELYNEELRDLLAAEYRDPSGSAQPMALAAQGGKGEQGGLKIYEDQQKRGAVMIQGLEEASIRNAGEALGLLLKGSQRRQVAETKMNSESSRSHSIFSLTVHLKETGAGVAGEDLLKVGKLNLVDLAGSEAIGRSGAVEKRAREAGMINQSLLTLGRVISALVEKSSHIPYRESKLTRLLQDSLGGRTKTCIVATVSPTKSNMEETLSTLDYAYRAKTIRNKPEVNQKMTKGALIKEYVVEMERLKQDLMAAREKNGVFLSAESWSEMQIEQESRQSQLDDALQRASTIEHKHATLTAEFEANMSLLLVRDEELRVVRQEVVGLEELLRVVKDELGVVKKELEDEKVVSEAYRKGEERLDGVARGLKGTVEASVKDVGGLFAKIARKAEVLATNTDAASAYGRQLNVDADQLAVDLVSLLRVQTDFGKSLQTELEAFAARGAQTLEQDKLFLDQQLTSFTKNITRLQSDFTSAQSESQLSLDSLDMIKEDLHGAMAGWMKQMRVETEQKAEAMVDKQKSHMELVTAATTDIMQMLQAVMAGALEQSETEVKAAKELSALSQKATQVEMQRLQAQNQRLSQLLVSERANSAKLRDSMVTQISSLLTAFTETQDQSLKAAVGEFQADNEAGMADLMQYEESYEAGMQAMSRGATQYAEDLGQVQVAADEHGQQAKQAIYNASSAVKDLSQQHSLEISTQLDNASSTLQANVNGLSTALSSERSRSAQMTTSQIGAIGQLNNQVAHTYDAAKERLITAKEDIKVVSAAVLSAHAAAEPVFSKACSAARNRVEDMRASNAVFVSSIREDAATGATPRKKAWNVPSAWNLTGAREEVLERHRSGQSHLSKEIPMESINSGEVDLAIAVEAPLPRSPELTSSQTSSSHSMEPLALSTPDQENVPPSIDSAATSRATSPVTLKVQTGLARPPIARGQTGKTGIGKLNTSQLGRSRTADDGAAAALGEAGASTNIPIRRNKRVA